MSERDKIYGIFRAVKWTTLFTPLIIAELIFKDKLGSVERRNHCSKCNVHLVQLNPMTAWVQMEDNELIWQESALG